ncbi:MAG: 5-(carboxyamino)imidazole ribonucleotide mutase [Gammaproteobacteria bacterium]|nr:MAG: 5-(carboxyamino)imidazole ribonucleotide mutase [Gammaproteobacteria bacterium]
MSEENQTFVAVMMGSDSDLPLMQATLDILTGFGIRHEVRILSAHRTPDDTHAYVRAADTRGCAVFIAAAGLAAHLAGTVAGITLKPVIGVPVEAGPLLGFDALLSTVQMPSGVPVATVAVGKAGAKNAAYLAAQILALGDSELAERLGEERRSNAEVIRSKDAEVRKDQGRG